MLRLRQSKPSGGSESRPVSESAARGFIGVSVQFDPEGSRVFIQFIIDAMLDLTRSAHPLMPVEIHVSSVNALYVPQDVASSKPIRYRGCPIVDDLHTDAHVILCQAAGRFEWVLAGNLRTGQITQRGDGFANAAVA